MDPFTPDLDDNLPPTIAHDGGPFGPRGPQGERGLPGLPGQPGPPGATAKLGEVLLTGSASTIGFASISQGYRHLKLIGRGRMATANANNYHIYIQFNGDSGNNYDWKCAADNSENYGDGAILICDFPLSTDLANHANPVSLEIPYYASGTWHKTLIGNAGNQFGVVGGSIQAGASYGRWRNTAAITDILIVSGGSSGQFAAGTIFSLYGES